MKRPILFFRRIGAFIVRDWRLAVSYRMQFFLQILSLPGRLPATTTELFHLRCMGLPARRRQAPQGLPSDASNEDCCLVGHIQRVQLHELYELSLHRE